MKLCHHTPLWLYVICSRFPYYVTHNSVIVTQYNIEINSLLFNNVELFSALSITLSEIYGVVYACRIITWLSPQTRLLYGIHVAAISLTFNLHCEAIAALCLIPYRRPIWGNCPELDYCNIPKWKSIIIKIGML